MAASSHADPYRGIARDTSLPPVPWAELEACVDNLGPQLKAVQGEVKDLGPRFESLEGEILALAPRFTALDDEVAGLPDKLKAQLAPLATRLDAAKTREAELARTLKESLATLKTELDKPRESPAVVRELLTACDQLGELAASVSSLQAAVSSLLASHAQTLETLRSDLAAQPAAPAPVRQWRIVLDRDALGRSKGTATLTAA